MRKILHIIAIGVALTISISSTGYAQKVLQSVKVESGESFTATKEGDGEWIRYDDGTSNNSIGAGATTYDVAIRFEPADLTSYDGMPISKVNVFVNNAVTTSTIKIWQGADGESLEEVASHVFTPTEEAWNEITLDEPYTIDAELELWVGVRYVGVDQKFPAGIDAATDHGGKGNMVRFPEDEEDNAWYPLTDLNADLVGDWNIAAWVGEAGTTTYNVTFNVDMTDAEGFDPATHKVYLTGTITGWVEPGNEGSIEMTRVTSKEDPTTVWEEGFEPGIDTGELPEGWTQKKADNAEGNDLEDIVEGDTQWWRYSELYDMGYSSGYNADWNHTGEASMHINWNVEAEQNVYAISPAIELEEAEEMTLEFWMYFSSAYETKLSVLLELDGTWEVVGSYNSSSHENLYEYAEQIDLTGKVGSARIAFVYQWSDGIQMNIDDVKISGTFAPAEELIYTATVAVEAGDIEYKYFSDAVGAGWEGGEWEGGANRTATISADVTLDDVWGDQPQDVDTETLNNATNVYPNPATDVLTVSHNSRISGIRVFDVTGRMMYNAEVSNLNTTTVDVSRFNEGVYILQVVTNEGIANKKFVVRK